MNYIDKNKDRIVGAHVTTYDDYWAKGVKESFENICKSKSVSNSVFYIVEKPNDKEIHDVISDLVNFNEKELVDFLILGHNPNKYGSYNSKFKGIPVANVIKNSQANILFYS
jgi:hypothetical protein